MDLLEKMATYVRVIEAGSFSAAAKQLRLSPAAVSRQMAALEVELRATLLTRSTRRMVVTPAGRRAYERCLRVLREVEDARAAGRGDALDGLLQVNAPVTFGLARVVPHLSALMTKHPGLRVDLRLEDRVIDLVLEGVDVAIRVGGSPPDSADVVAHRLSSFRRVLVAAPAYLKRQGAPRSPEALARHAALTWAVGSNADTWTLLGEEREARVRVDVAFRSNALHAVRALAIDGAGIALLPDWLVADALRTRALRAVLPTWSTEPVVVYALHRTERRGEPRVRAFVEHLRAEYGVGPDGARGDRHPPSLPARRPLPRAGEAGSQEPVQ